MRPAAPYKVRLGHIPEDQRLTASVSAPQPSAPFRPRYSPNYNWTRGRGPPAASHSSSSVNGIATTVNGAPATNGAPFRRQLNPNGIFRNPRFAVQNPAAAATEPRRPASPENDLIDESCFTGGPPGIFDGYCGARYWRNLQSTIPIPYLDSDEEEDLCLSPEKGTPSKSKAQPPAVPAPKEIVLPGQTAPELFHVTLRTASTVVLVPTALSELDMSLGAYLGNPRDTGVFTLLESLRKEMFDAYKQAKAAKTVPSLTSNERKEGNLIAVQIPGTNMYHRAVIESAGTRFKCYLVDIGICVFLPLECLYPLLPQFCLLPGLAVTVRLAHFIKPKQHSQVKAVLRDIQQQHSTVELTITGITRGNRLCHNLHLRFILEGCMVIDNVDLSVRVAQLCGMSSARGTSVSPASERDRAVTPENPEENALPGMDENEFYWSRIEKFSF